MYDDGRSGTTRLGAIMSQTLHVAPSDFQLGIVMSKLHKAGHAPFLCEEVLHTTVLSVLYSTPQPPRIRLFWFDESSEREGNCLFGVEIRICLS